MALHGKDANTKKLGSIQRTFSKTPSFGASTSKLDQDSDQLGSDDWPASQNESNHKAKQAKGPPKAPSATFGQVRGSNSTAQSSNHWRTKSSASFMSIASTASSSALSVSHKRNLSTSQAMDIMGDLDPKGRRFPWDNLSNEPSKKKTKTSSISRGSAFYAVGGGSAGPSRVPSTESIPGGVKTVDSASNLTSKSLSIKQKVVLSPEQQRVLKLVVEEGKNIFFTGSAGTGKSVLLREIISSLKKKHRSRPDAVAVTASTGMAACNIGGTTIHSFGGIGIAEDSVDSLVGKIRKNRKASGRWQRTLVLVVDEVSMVDGDLFDKLNSIAKALRKKPNLPFGGIQLVVTGDFFQLPPVSKGSSAAKFAFESAAWRECIPHTVNLSQVFRQKDTQFIDMLNEMRFGTLSEKSIAKFKELARKPKYPDDGIEPTELFPLRNEVERSNQGRLSGLTGETRHFMAEDSGEADPEERKRLAENFMAPARLTLKEGAQVMLIKNKDETLVNGSLGIVSHFAPPGGRPEDDDDSMLFNEGGHEFDFRPAKGEGGLPQDIKDLAMKKPGGVATASRVQEEVPWIKWSLPDGRTSPAEPVAREEFKVEQGNIIKVKRKQFPLMLAWAVSIHKSQGQTLARVKVDLSKVFEAGQTYVALSRATSLDALQVIGFQPSRVRCHPRVKDWAKTLASVDSIDSL